MVPARQNGKSIPSSDSDIFPGKVSVRKGDMSYIVVRRVQKDNQRTEKEALDEYDARSGDHSMVTVER